MSSNPPALENLGDPALAVLARADDSAAFAELWRRHAAAGIAAARQFSAIADPQDIVSEAYLRIFRALKDGGGPHEAFRPYLYRTIRNIALDWRSRLSSVSLEVTPELVDDEADPELTVLDNRVTAQAFDALPERWRAVLWYMEVEDMSPSEVAPLLGISPNATSVLASRAHEGFKKAWLQAHVNDRSVPAECQWTTERMGDYVRRGLTKRSRARFDRHIEDCARCTLLIQEIGDLGGRLAVVLLPAMLGATAGSALLGQLVQHHSAPVAGVGTRASLGRKALIAGAGVVSLALIATSAYAISTMQQPAPPPAAVDTDADTDADEPRPPVDPRPVPSDTPSPEPTVQPPESPAPPRPPVKPAPVIPSPPDVTPPAAPVLLNPADGLLVNVATPSFSGVGEPGATVVVHRVDSSTGALVVILSVIAAADGGWSGLVQNSLSDGVHELQFSQKDRAGNWSAAVSRTITVDTEALAPVVNPVAASPLVFLPVVSGQAEPGAEVTLRDEVGTVVAVTNADEHGDWAAQLPDPERDGTSISASQEDRAGNISPSSAASPPISFVRPEFVSPVSGTVISSTGGGTVVEVVIQGETGRHVQVFVDGVGTGNVHELEAGPITRVTAPLADGAHTIAIRYFDPVTGEAGSVHTVEILIA